MWKRSLAFAAFCTLASSLSWSEAQQDSPPDFTALVRAINQADLSERQRELLTPPIEALIQDSQRREARFKDLLLTLGGTQQDSNQFWKLSGQERQEWGTKVLTWQVATAGAGVIAIAAVTALVWQAVHR